MWMWVLARSSRGDWPTIADMAHRYGVRTLILKGSDGRTQWGQFSPGLVSFLHSEGLRICAYQFIYGSHPLGEANVGVRLARLGADCLLIDAEGQYEGRYWQAQAYIGRLRQKLGQDYPLALAGFPYVHYHPGYPYSVFLAPGGAQLNVPQVYWRAIGTSVDNALAITYRYNRVYGRPILPLGQVYMDPPLREIRRFRALSQAYGAPGVSWWVWQDANASEWRAVSTIPLLPLTAPEPGYPSLQRGNRGDLVVWAQQHLLSAGLRIKVNGIFGRRMQTAVRDFQFSAGLPPVGKIGPRTWQALLPHGPAAVRWSRRQRARPIAAAATGGRPAPASASLPARRNELGHRPH